MSKVWFTSDTHWGHANIIKYSKRPYKDVREMNDALIHNWNAVVQPTDVVWHLGDVAFMRVHELKGVLSRLNGMVCFLKGNHDRSEFDELWKDASSWIPEPAKFHVFEQCHEIKEQGQLIILCHYGMRVWNRSHRGSWNLYGHSHGSLKPDRLQVDVGVDAPFITGKPEYRPFSFDEIKRYMQKRSIAVHDHHGAM